MDMLTDGVLRFHERMYVPESIQEKVLEEAHKSNFAVRPRSTKMYCNLHSWLWLRRIKVNVAEYVAKCPTCQQVKTEHQRPTGFLQPLPIAE